MMEAIEDLNVMAPTMKKPMIVFLAGRDKIIKNNCSKTLMSKFGTPKTDVKLRLYPNSFHNIHKEPEYKHR